MAYASWKEGPPGQGHSSSRGPSAWNPGNGSVSRPAALCKCRNRFLGAESLPYSRPPLGCCQTSGGAISAQLQNLSLSPTPLCPQDLCRTGKFLAIRARQLSLIRRGTCVSHRETERPSTRSRIRPIEQRRESSNSQSIKPAAASTLPPTHGVPSSLRHAHVTRAPGSSHSRTEPLVSP